MLIGMIVFVSVSVSAMPYEWGGGGGPYVPLPPTTPPSFPTPPSGYYTTDCPSGMVITSVNVVNGEGANQRNYSSAETWESDAYDWSYIEESRFVDTIHVDSVWDNWPRQIIPPANATILDVNLIVVYLCQNGPSSGALQFSLDYGVRNTWYPWLNFSDPGIYHTFASTGYSSTPVVYYFNATPLHAWTASDLVSFNLYIMFSQYVVTGLPHASMLIDYVGLEYNWTISGPATNYTYTTPQGPIFNVSGDTVKGIMGTIGFVGMVGLPAGCIYMARVRDEGRAYFFVVAVAGMAFFFSLFIGAIS